MTRIGSLCSGYEGLGMAVQSVLSGELAWVADNDPGAAAILAHRFPDVPNLGDITAIDWSAVEPADILLAGFPCQPVSAAGRRAGISDERWLFDDIATAIGRMVARPRLLVLENVPGLLSANGGDAMAHVVQGLAALGYVGRYRLLRASDAGAPHKRERIFILAWPAQDADRAAGGERRLAAPGQAPGGRPRADAGRPGGAPAPADADSQGRQGGESARGYDLPAWSPAADAQGDRRDEGRPESARLIGRPDAALGGHGPAADAERGGRDGRPQAPERRTERGATARRHSDAATDWGRYALAIRRWEHVAGRPAPRPTEPGRTGERLSPQFVEWMQGLPDGWVTGVPGLSRNAQLKALGNGVVPQQAELALRLLLDRSGLHEAGEAA